MVGASRIGFLLRLRNRRLHRLPALGLRLHPRIEIGFRGGEAALQVRSLRLGFGLAARKLVVASARCFLGLLRFAFSLLAGTAASLMGGGAGWLGAALLIGAVVPFTFVVVLPTNHALLAPDRDLASDETRALLERWARLHAVRTVLSLAATAVYLVLLSRV